MLMLWMPAALAVPCEERTLSEADALVLGEGEPAEIGRALGPLPGGFLVGAPFDEDGDVEAGAVYAIAGPIAGTLAIDEVATKTTSDRPFQQAGSAVAGDRDLWVGAPAAVGGRGAVYVLPWPDKKKTLKAGVRVLGEAADDGFGTSVVVGTAPFGPGAAVAVGAPRAGTGGRVYVFDAAAVPQSRDNAALVVSDVSPSEQFGWAIALGDLDGDGLGDLAVGAPAVGAGRVYLFYGPQAVPSVLDVRAADAVIEGGQPGDRAGQAVSVAPGVDGGAGGLLVGAPLAQNGLGKAVGRACWFAGERLTGTVSLDDAPLCLWGTVPGGQAGASVASGDVNADGFGDLWVGAPEDGAGVAHLVLGPAVGVVPLSRSDGRVEGTRVGDQVGAALLVIEDLDADSYPETLVGGPGYDGRGAVAAVNGGFCAPALDADRDGSPASEDCDDANPEIGPQALEICGDGIDQDCDGRDACPDEVRPGCVGTGGTFGFILPFVMLLWGAVPLASGEPLWE